MTSGAIDVHAHWFPPLVVEAFERLGSRRAWPQHGDSLAERAAGLAESTFSTQIIGLGHNQPNFDDRRASLECAQLCNDLYATEITKYPSLFRAFAALPLPHIEDSLAEAARCLDDHGFAGVGIGTTVCGMSLSNTIFDPLWSYLDHRGSVVFVHPVGTPDTMTTGMDEFLLGPKFGGPHEMGVAGIHLIVSGVTLRWPNIKWILAPMGGTLTYLWRRFEEISQSLSQTSLLVNNFDEAVRNVYFDTTLTDDPAVLEFAVKAIGADKLVIGTDAPRVEPAAWLQAITTGLAITGADIDAIQHRTARAELGL